MNIKNTLAIRGLELTVSLGWEEAERKHKQPVFLDVFIYFRQTPDACMTDRLDDTICYSSLITALHAYVGEKQFQLIEYLSKELHHLIETQLPEDASVCLKLTKHPALSGLTGGGVSFTYGDEKQAWSF